MGFTLGNKQVISSSGAQQQSRGDSGFEQGRARSSVKVGGDDYGLHIPGKGDEYEFVNTDNGVLKLAEGGNILLFLPPKAVWGFKTPWVEFYQHFIAGEPLKLLGFDELPEDVEPVYFCEGTHRRPCAWCDVVNKLYKGGGRDRAVAKKWSKSFTCKANVVHSADTDLVRLYQFGTKIHRVLKQSLLDGELFHHPQRLMPVRITRTGSGMLTEYTTKVLHNADTYAIRAEWVGQYRELTSEIPTQLASGDVADLLAILMAETDGLDRKVPKSAPSAGVNYGFDVGPSASADDDIPF